MEPRDWSRIQEIYNSALDISRAGRSAYIASKCKGDPAAESEVRALLDAYESSGDFLETPVFESGLKVLTDSEDPLVGTIVGERYRVELLLAQGGMGKVYLATDRELNREVALKVLSQTLLLDVEAKKRFKREVEALTRIGEHPNVVTVYGTGELSDGTPYVAMQYIDGPTLRSLISNNQIDRQRAAAILKQIGAGLGHIHSKNIIHRDLKPENIMIQVFDDGTELVKILDFGIATVRDSIVTRTVHNLPIGTLPYMSPEQRNGDELTPASDVYAMAIVAYEMVTGERPANPPSVPRRQGLSRNAQRVISGGLSRKPQARPQNAKQFGEDLSKALPAWDLSKLFAVAAAVLVVVLLSYGIYSYVKTSGPLPPSKGFNYWLMVQRMRDGQNYRDPYKSNGAESYALGDKFQLNVSTLYEPGNLYVFNEGPPETGKLSFRLIYPKKDVNNGSATLAAQQTVQSDWITFRGPAGAENVWMVWSVSPVPELEVAKNQALMHPEAGLTGEDLSAVKEFLKSTQASIKVWDASYKEGQESKVRARSDVVLTLARFEYR